VTEPTTRNGTKVERLNGTSIPQLNPSRGGTSSKRCRVAHPRMICKAAWSSLHRHSVSRAAAIRNPFLLVFMRP